MCWRATNYAWFYRLYHHKVFSHRSFDCSKQQQSLAKLPNGSRQPTNTLRDLASSTLLSVIDPNGIRTHVTGVKGQCPRPLDDGALT